MKRLAVIVSAFPDYYETSMAREFMALKERGVELDIFALNAPNDDVHHDWVKKLGARVTYADSAVQVIVAFFNMMLKRPGRFFPTCFSLMRVPMSPLSVFVTAHHVFTRAVYIAQIMSVRGHTTIHGWGSGEAADCAFIAASILNRHYSISVNEKGLYGRKAIPAKMVRGARKIIAASADIRKRLTEIAGEMPDEKLALIHPGVDIEAMTPPESKNDDFTIVAAGRAVERKGFPYLIEACGILRNNGIDYTCSIFGEGPARKEMRTEITKHNITHLVKLVGETPHEKLLSKIAGTSVLVAPSITCENGERDGIPDAVLEAMALGTPVIATDAGGLPEAIIDEETGLLVPEKDAAAIAGALKRLRNDPGLRSKLAGNARRRLVDMFDIRRNVVELEKILEVE
ncbi:glycosyltransferase family 4 protein [Candidatus Hydrogenedentota bacterium]